MTRYYRLVRWLVLALLLALLPAVALAQDDGTITDDEVNEVAKDLYCPVCESTPLDVCPTQACADWRELIRTKLAAGETRQDVLDYFARQYGDGVLADPPRHGASLVVLWVLPVLVVLLGALLFARLLRSMRATGPAATVAGMTGTVTTGTATTGTATTGTAATGTAAPPPRADERRGDEALDDYIARVERELKE